MKTKSTKCIHYKGIKSDNCFSRLKDFHIIESLPPDLMHDFLEGSLMKCFGCLMVSLKKKKLYSVSELNNDLRNFRYQRQDGRNKVPYNLFSETTKKFRLSATHAWTLVKIVPILLGIRFRDDRNYLNFMSLIEIYQMLTDDSYDDEKLIVLTNNIDAFLKEFKLNYEDIKLSAKMHFMIHYPRAIRLFGPPIDYSTMRWDSKHHYLKRVHHVTNNHINLLKSMAFRHQNFQLFHLSSTGNYFVEQDFGTFHSINNQIKDFISIKLDTNHLVFYNYIAYQRTTYTVNDLVVVQRKSMTNAPKFAKISTIVYDTRAQIIYLVVEEYITIDYKKYLTGYIIQERNDQLLQLIELSDLGHYAPLDSYFITDEKEITINIVIPKYAI
jgi:hypothetical protein